MPDKTDDVKVEDQDDEKVDDSSGNDQPGKDNDGGDDGGKDNEGGDDEEVTIKKSELEQIKTDRDNYREGLLKKKADDRNLGGKKDDDEEGGGGDDEKVDAKKITDDASAATLDTIGKSNEKRAKRIFLKQHPEYVDDALWADLMSEFVKKKGNATLEDVLDDMSDAIFNHKRRSGKLDEFIKSEREAGRQEGRNEANAETGRDAGGTGDGKDEGAGTKLSSKGKEMAQGMHNDPKKVEKVDPSKDGVIEVT